MEEEVPFEAEHVLQELYNLDAVVQGVQAGTWERYTCLPPLLSPAVLYMWHCCTHPHVIHHCSAAAAAALAAAAQKLSVRLC